MRLCVRNYDDGSLQAGPKLDPSSALLSTFASLTGVTFRLGVERHPPPPLPPLPADGARSLWHAREARLWPPPVEMKNRTANACR